MTSPIVVLADDLSGAAEVAGVFLGRAVDVSLSLDHAREAAEVAVVDLDSRSIDAELVDGVVRSIMDALPSDTRVIGKIDSLLRGNVAATVHALAAKRPVVVAGGLPLLNRVVRGGVLLVDDIPLADTGLWSAEAAAPPDSIAALVKAPLVDIADLEDATGIVVCDIETDDDLDRVVAAVADRPEVVLVGTSALAAAVARTMPARPSTDEVTAVSESILVVVGTASAAAVEQVERLKSDGVHVMSIRARDLLDGCADATALGRVLDIGSVALTVDGPVDPSISRALTAALAAYVRDGLGSRAVDLALTGGETARAVLTALGISTLRPVGHVHYGAVVSIGPDERRIVTRPGSFGDPDSLSAIHSYLTGSPSVSNVRTPLMTSTQTLDLPFVALTMGDAAGIGPEVIVPAMLDARVASWCRPVVIGDRERLRLAAGVLGLDPEIVAIEHISDAVFTPGRINVIDLGLIPEDMPWGQLSAVAGNAAYEYIRVASELAIDGQVQAICTAPLNKEALHAAGHIFPGHTELLAHLTGTEEVSMMLSTPKLKVIHVTTHIGLLDAVAKIEPGLVERTIRRGHEALVRSGVAHPKIGVCGINPHAGENGLFGYGEEDMKIVPAVEVLHADGIDVVGPLPADTAFFLAGRGDYDLIVAMYHDQGHGPVKVLGIEAGVNISVGLPVIRTSVDHGTAFDIAGKGIAEAGSMVEALRQAAELATTTAGVE
ncbi:MAG: 4-hydroxythreonine-4-phosphate dehydrogenase PdxA [Rhodococcus sp. (in: high G+C Gram-positive bacteria)]|uniref:4-hydroxythreonine-4-phosphate dehydrogenase PdxA n=1 Tax=Rhodococcus sp. TaxID=1831 RepID=UPI002ADB8EAF|nr:4-hydroxythreonine-4-phosphate dehydrogenase PdxA [Rhodococcus sp. (in: high G+C Gram-positive bacteria)]